MDRGVSRGFDEEPQRASEAIAGDLRKGGRTSIACGDQAPYEVLSLAGDDPYRFRPPGGETRRQLVRDKSDTADVRAALHQPYRLASQPVRPPAGAVVREIAEPGPQTQRTG